MNYIEQINNFWAKSEDLDMSGLDISVYMALLKYCNRLNWLNPFVCHWDIVCQTSKVSKNAYYKSIERLNDLGFIKYDKGVKNSTIKPKIFILELKNKQGIIREQTSNKEGINEEQIGNLIKRTNNLTFKQVNSILEHFNSLDKNKIDSEIKKLKKDTSRKSKNSKESEFKKKLLDLGVDEKYANDWIQVRKEKRASFTDSAIDGVIKECEKYNFPFPEAIKNCAERSWQGFKYEWLRKEEPKKEYQPKKGFHFVIN